MLQTNYSGKLECGVDEVGRGCLAGPVYAAAVVLPPDYYHKKLKDSKKMTAKAREEVYEDIYDKALSICICSVPADKIDDVNILNATMIAMHAAIDGLSVRPEVILVDGNQFKQYPNIQHECIIKGDDKVTSIAAASVVAKVTRDRIMGELSKIFPGYGWESNKGYGTKVHIEALRSLGPTTEHRLTFIKSFINDSK